MNANVPDFVDEILMTIVDILHLKTIINGIAKEGGGLTRGDVRN